MSRPTDELRISLTSRFISERDRAGHGTLDFHASGNDVAGITLTRRPTSSRPTQEGNLYGYINSVLDYTGMFRTNGHSGTLSIPRASIAVPTQSSRDLQDLGAHGEVFVIGETRVSSGHGRPCLSHRRRLRDGLTCVGSTQRLRDCDRDAWDTFITTLPAWHCAGRSLKRARRAGGSIRQAVLLRTHRHGFRRFHCLQPVARRCRHASIHPKSATLTCS